MQKYISGRLDDEYFQYKFVELYNQVKNIKTDYRDRNDFDKRTLTKIEQVMSSFKGIKKYSIMIKNQEIN